MRTPLVEKQIDDQARAHGIPRDQVINDVLLKNQPNKRFVEVAELAALAVFLCTPRRLGDRRGPAHGRRLDRPLSLQTDGAAMTEAASILAGPLVTDGLAPDIAGRIKMALELVERTRTGLAKSSPPLPTYRQALRAGLEQFGDHGGVLPTALTFA